jgi:hypothetical protein
MAKVCPECGHEFQGNGWDGIDAHWRAKHEHIMPYGVAWPLIESGRYKRKSKEDFSQTAARIVRQTTERAAGPAQTSPPSKVADKTSRQ